MSLIKLMFINVKKCICIRIGERHKADVDKIVINAECMKWKCELKYLGVYFVASKGSQM